MGKYTRTRITSDVIARLLQGETLMDTVEPSLGIRRQKGGACIWFVRLYARGARHWETLGENGTEGLTPTTARERASRIAADIRSGYTPSERRSRDQRMPTMAAFASEWLETQIKPNRKPKTYELYEGALRLHVVPRLGRVRVDQIESEHVETLHRALARKPYLANRCLAILSRMMNHAEKRKLRSQNTNPVRHVERYEEKKRKRYLRQNELVALGVALSSREVAAKHAPQAIAAIAFLLLTGCRLREVLHLKWSEVNFDRRILDLADSKTGGKELILGAHALDVLQATDRHEVSHYVFPSPVDPMRPMYDVKKTWATVSRLAGLKDVRVHDLRHAYASIAVSDGGSLPFVGQLLGHSSSKTTERYAHLHDDPVRALADRTSATIAGALGTSRRSKAVTNDGEQLE